MIDNSGIVVTYTPNLRQFDAGMLMLGDVVVREYPIPALTSSYAIESNCPEECTSQWDNDITIFGDMLHMHQVGSMAWSTQSRNGVMIEGYLNRVEFWDFDFQSLPPLTRVIKRGDSINTHCVYDTSAINTSVNFGPASSDEMCLEILAYYPRLLTPAIDGRRNIYGFCGKLRGVYNNATGPQPNPNRLFATICGDLTMNSLIFDSDGFSVNNPTIPDPPGGIVRTFGQLPAQCAPPAILPESPDKSDISSTLVLALGIICGILLVVFLVTLFFRAFDCENSSKNGYQSVGGDDNEMRFSKV